MCVKKNQISFYKGKLLLFKTYDSYLESLVKMLFMNFLRKIIVEIQNWNESKHFQKWLEAPRSLILGVQSKILPKPHFVRRRYSSLSENQMCNIPAEETQNSLITLLSHLRNCATPPHVLGSYPQTVLLWLGQEAANQSKDYPDRLGKEEYSEGRADSWENKIYFNDGVKKKTRMAI